MHRFYIPFRFAVYLLWPALTGTGSAVEAASGFGPDATPAERQLAARPEPDRFFREMAGFWHGVPGLEALRVRWEGFAGEDAGFAVLAALLSEAAGKPEEALEKLRALTGSDARWNEGRLLALLGREQEAVAILSALVTAAERAETGAAALIALTELDCIRGNFAAALERTIAAWEARNEEEFRLRIQERHLSLLVEAGREREFLEEQVKIAESTGDEAAAGTAQRVLAVMADWFRADARLQQRSKDLAPAYRTMPDEADPWGRGREFGPCGLLMPQGGELLRRAAESSLPREQVFMATYQLVRNGTLPGSVEAVPWLRHALVDQPFRISGVLFNGRNALEPLPPLAAGVAEAVESGPVRRTMDLLVRAWAGQAGPTDAETLSAIVVEAPATRRRRPLHPASPISMGSPGWPRVDFFPSKEVIWNLQGVAWTDFYRRSCRWSALRDNNSNAPWFSMIGSPVWAQWRPDWPLEGVENLMGWAWQQLLLMGEATPERAATIAGRMSDPGDRVLFAAHCGRTELLVQWCREESFLKGVRTASLTRAAHAFGSRLPERRLTHAESETIMTLVPEIARRVELDVLDVVRMNSEFHGAAPPEMREKIAHRAVDPLLAATLGMLSYEPAVQTAWQASLPHTVPHPLFGLPVCPSVERFRMMAFFLDLPPEQPHLSQKPPCLAMIRLLMGGEGPYGYAERPPELDLALAAFPTAHPLKHQLQRWGELHAASGQSKAQRYRFRDPEQKEWQDQAAKVLRVLAAEEQVFLPWHLASAALEEDAGKREIRLDVLRQRSPLSAGCLLPGTRSPRWEGASGVALTSTPEQVAGLFLNLITDPAGRSRLEPVGNITSFLQQGMANAFVLAWRQLAVPDMVPTAERLLASADPLAVRMAVLMATANSQNDLLPWLRRSLTVCPDDPELLLAYAAQSNYDDEAGKAAFRHAMQNLTTLGAPSPHTDSWFWCGIERPQLHVEGGAAQAIAAMVTRVRPANLPAPWIELMHSVLKSPTELATLTDVRSVALATARYQVPGMSRNGNHPDWMSILEALVKSGHGAEASSMAEALLATPTGSLADPGSLGEPAFPWNNPSGVDAAGPKAEGWQWLQLAGQSDPAALAERLAAAAAAHPADESIALSALLARGRAEPGGELDLTILDPLTASGRHRAVAYASWLLPQEGLPAATLIGAWEAEAAAEFSNVENGYRNYLQGNQYLDRLEAAGALDAVRRSLPQLLKGTEKVGEMPPGYPAPVLARLRRLGTPEQAAALLASMDRHLHALPEDSRSYPALANLLNTLADEEPPAAPSPEIVRRVTWAFTAATDAAMPAADDFQRHSLVQLAYAAAGDPRWHESLTALLAKHGRSLLEAGNGQDWSRLKTLLTVMASDRQIPSVKLELHPTGVGQGRLRWSFSGLLPLPPPPDPIYQIYDRAAPDPLLWSSLAQPLGGQFEARLIVRETASTAERAVAYWDRLPAAGELILTDLPPAGRLRLQLIRRKDPRHLSEGPAFGYNTLPILMDTEHPRSGTARDPAEWHLLTDPSGLPAAGARWHIRYHGKEGASPPEGLAMLLLDAAGQISAGATLFPNGRDQNHEFAGFPGSLLGADRLSPAFRPSGAVEEGNITVSGPPTQFALARPRAAGRPYDPGIPAHLTVQEWPAAPSAADFAGSLEILRLWQRRAPSGSDGGQEYPPALSDSPQQAAWYSKGRLTVLDLEKEGAPHALDLPVDDAGLTFQRLFWQGGLLHLQLYDAGSASAPLPASVLLSLDPSLPPPWPAPHRFDGDTQILESYPYDIPGVTLFTRENEIQAVLAGSRLLLPPPASSGPSPRLIYQRPLSATRVACQRGEDGTFPVLDWSDGTLRLSFRKELPPPEAFPAAGPLPQVAGDGNVTYTTAEARTTWRCPLQLKTVQPVGPGVLLGSVNSGSTSSVVLLREVPLPAKP